MATKIQNNVVALTAAFVLSIVGSASADTVIQNFEGSFEVETAQGQGTGNFIPFSDNQIIGNGGQYLVDAPAIGFGAPMNPDLNAANGPVGTPLIRTTDGGTGLSGGGTRSAAFEVDWRAWNNTEINNIADGDPNNDPPADFFAGALFKNQTGLNDLSKTTGWFIELGYNGEVAETRLQAIISDREYSYGLVNPVTLVTGAGGALYGFSIDEADYVITDRPVGADPVNDRSFSDVLSNVTAFGIALLRPNNSISEQFIGSDPIATVTLDNITVTPEPSSMILLGAGCMLFVGSRKLRKA